MSESNPLERIQRAEEALYDAVLSRNWPAVMDTLADGARGVFLIEHNGKRVSPFDLLTEFGAPDDLVFWMRASNLPSTNTVKALLKEIEQRKPNAGPNV